MSELTVIVLAAGGGTRMKSKTPKMLHQIAGRSLVGHVLAAVSEAGATRVVTVVGHQRELVEPHIAEILPETVMAVQEEQLGTAHAVRMAVETASVATGTVEQRTLRLGVLSGTTLKGTYTLKRTAKQAKGKLSATISI